MTIVRDAANLTRNDLIAILSAGDRAGIEAIRRQAEETLLDRCGDRVRMRGIIEFSNICDNDCFYCGIRKSNRECKRYSLDAEAVEDCACSDTARAYGSIVLQSGERTDEKFISFVETTVRRIKERTRSDALPEGVGITLCVGEQSEETYHRFFVAGAHRYLLRIETTNRNLFARLHQPGQEFEKRVEALRALKRVGFQVGTGVMIGLPGQTAEDLADDLLFFASLDVDMIGMGPYVLHGNTPMASWPETDERSPQERFALSLRMIAAARLLLKDVNIAATTALQAIDPRGREEGLRWGANVIMPQLTPPGVRSSYQLYEGKPCLDESAEECRRCLEARITALGRTIGYGEWGDSRHFFARRQGLVEHRRGKKRRRCSAGEEHGESIHALG